MMKIIVFADSHGRTGNMWMALKAQEPFDQVIHAGDFGTDVDEIAAFYPMLNIAAVHGNTDRIASYPEQKILDLDGYRILVTHGHQYGVKYRLEMLREKALQEKADAVVFGHTHSPLVERNGGILMVNPGSISQPRNARVPSYAVLEITSEGIRAHIHQISK